MPARTTSRQTGGQTPASLALKMDGNSIEIAQMVNKAEALKAFHEFVTKIASSCFDTCIKKPTQGQISDADKTCLSNCAQIMLQVRGLMARRIQVNMNSGIDEKSQIDDRFMSEDGSQ